MGTPFVDMADAAVILVYPHALVCVLNSFLVNVAIVAGPAAIFFSPVVPTLPVIVFLLAFPPLLFFWFALVSEPIG